MSINTRTFLALLASILAVAITPGLVKAQAVEELEVKFQGAEDGVSLSGTLLLPVGDGPHPAVLFVAGTGDHERDQEISGFPMFRVMAERLAEAGIGSLRFDKRGVGGSTGDPWPNQTTSSSVRDCQCALEYLQSRGRIDATRVGVVGHSEGAMIAPRLGGTKTPAFLVLLSAPAIPMSDLYLSQRLDWFDSRPRSKEQRVLFYSGTKRMIALAADPNALETQMSEAAKDILVGIGKSPDEVTEAGIQMVFSNFLTPWMREHMRDDPRPALKSINVPVLAVYGRADEQVPWHTNFPALASCLGQANTNDVSVLGIPDQGHFFLRIPGSPPNVHKYGKMVLSKALLTRMTTWVASKTLP